MTRIAPVTRRVFDMRGERCLIRGYTLVELIAVMTIIAIIGAASAVFLRLPLQMYQDAERRAAISDAADTAFALIKRDLQTALPNSVRVTNAGAVFYLEFLQMRAGGRYRAEAPIPAIATSASTCADSNANAIADENVLQSASRTAVSRRSARSGARLDRAPAISSCVQPGPVTPMPTRTNTQADGGQQESHYQRYSSSGGENVITFQPPTFRRSRPPFSGGFRTGLYVCDPVRNAHAHFGLSDHRRQPRAGGHWRAGRAAPNGCT